MKILGTRSVKLDRLVMPGDMRQRMTTQNVEDLADDLHRWSAYINDPLVRESDMRIIAGRDRLAAAQKLGFQRLEVKLCECTDEEAERLEIAENLHRRQDDQVALRRHWLDLMERQIADEAPGPDAEKPRGRPATARGKARAQLAEKLGVTRSAVEKLDRPAEPSAPAASSWGDDEEPAEEEPPIETLGTQPDMDWLAGVREVQELIDEADRQAQLLQATLTKLGKARLSLPQGRWQRLYKAAHVLAHDLRAARPVSVCHWCKLVPVLKGVCTACATNGYVVDDQMAAVPKELLSVGMVVQNNRFVPIEKVTTSGTWAERATPARKGMRVIVQDDDGDREIEVDRE